MGVAVERWPKINKTTELASWISRIKNKKTKCKYQKRKNLFIETVLSNALVRAETELRQKQQERRLRWQRLMSKCAINTNSCDKLPQNFDLKIYEQINADLDNFMNQLNQKSYSAQS